MSKRANYGYLLKNTVNSIVTPPSESEEHTDLQIMRKILQLFSIQNQKIDCELETGLLQFSLIFKTQILSHSCMLDIGFSMISEGERGESSEGNDAMSLDFVANMLGFTEM